jgi:PAS domain S-box-containing protein
MVRRIIRQNRSRGHSLWIFGPYAVERKWEYILNWNTKELIQMAVNSDDLERNPERPRSARAETSAKLNFQPEKITLMNCWEFMNCGRVPGGASAEAFGVCPAFTCGAGQACWLVAGTMCGGQIQGTLARKIDSCLACDFFNQFGEQERSAARLRFGQIVMMTTILDTVGALVMVVDAKGRIVRFNRTCEQITGYAFSEVRGRPIGEIFLIPEEVQSVKAVFEELRTTGYPSRHESTLVTKSGDRRLIAWANTLFADANGLETHFITTGIDITESRQIETKLQKSENWHRALVQTAMDGFWLVDTQGQSDPVGAVAENGKFFENADSGHKPSRQMILNRLAA